MSKKEKKVFKARLTLAPKVTMNRKWTNWRQQFHRNLKLYSINMFRSISTSSLLQSSSLDLIALSLINNPTGQRSSASGLKVSCYFVGRSRGFSREWSMSRHTFRRLARSNTLLGLSKTTH